MLVFLVGDIGNICDEVAPYHPIVSLEKGYCTYNKAHGKDTADFCIYYPSESAAVV